VSPPARRSATTHVSNILIVDDHPIVRRGIAQLIQDEHDLQVCGEADSPEAALTLLESTRPDLAIVDLTLARANGLALIKEIQARDAKLPVLVLSMHDEALYAERVLRAGAAGYIMKQEATEHIVEAIRQVLAGRVYVSERMTARMLHRMVGDKHEAAESPLDTLTTREMEVLQLLGQGLSTREIAAQLFVSVKTIETHLDHLKTKLRVDSGRQLVHYATRLSLGDF
jgi:DNA-binding NarL/FixJ family response regulator